MEKNYLQVATQAAQAGCEILKKYTGTITRESVSSKKAFDFITHVDRDAENAIITIIKNYYPTHAIFAEESQKDERSTNYRWIIDPLDGTTNFIHGFPVFSVSIALEYGEEIIVGIIADPTRNEIFSAERGKGAYLNGNPIHVTSTTALEHVLLTTGFPFRVKHHLEAYLRSFQAFFTDVSAIRRAGSAALDLAYLACGRCDGFWEISLNPWDIAAGALIVEEAGGKITDFTGGSDYIWNGNVIASNGYIHNYLLKTVAETIGDIFRP